MSEYDQDTHTPGRSREVDAIAHEAAAGMHDKGFKTNSEDSTNTHESPRGNPDAPGFDRGAKIGG